MPSATSRQFFLIHQDIDPTLRNVEAYGIAISYQPQSAAGGCLRRDVQDNGAKRSSAHARIGNAHHVLHTLCSKLLGDWQIASFRHAGAANRSCVSQNQHVRSEEHTSELQSLMRISYAVF